MIGEILKNKERVKKTLLIRLLGLMLLLGTIIIFQTAEPLDTATSIVDSDCTACIYTGILGITALCTRCPLWVFILKKKQRFLNNLALD